MPPALPVGQHWRSSAGSNSSQISSFRQNNSSIGFAPLEQLTGSDAGLPGYQRHRHPWLHRPTHPLQLLFRVQHLRRCTPVMTSTSRLLPEGIRISIAVFLVVCLRNTDGPGNQGASAMERLIRCRLWATDCRLITFNAMAPRLH